MKYDEFNYLYSRLKYPEDIERLAKSEGYQEELLLVLYTQRAVRNATRSFYKVKHKAENLLKRWEGGRSFVKLARDLDFPPVLMAMILMREAKVPRKTFWVYVREPKNIKDNRLRREILEVVAEDILYSPEGNEVQRKRGVWGEEMLCDWLDANNLKYRTEKELRDDYPKTPDALLDEPLKWNGMEIKWIESKASFGDKTELKKNARKQLKPYVDLFGHGIVVYWFGYLEGIEDFEDFLVVDRDFFKKHCVDDDGKTLREKEPEEF